MAWKTMVTELLWFLRGDTNIKYLVDNNCHIWNGDAYKNYLKWFDEQCKSFKDHGIVREPWTKEQYIEQIKLGNVDADLSDLGPIYGKQWRNWGEEKQMDLDTSTVLRVENGIEKHPYKEFISKQGIDQIQNLINELKTNPDSRRLMVSAWNVGELDQMVLPPCHYGFQVYTRELNFEERCKIQIDRLDGMYSPEKDIFIKSSIDEVKLMTMDKNNIPTRAISLMWNQRSCDFPLGIPMNISSYALLLMMIADEVNMVPDELIGNLGDCHIYLNQIDGVKEQITREPYPLPTVHVRDGIFCSSVGDVILENYQSHPKIHFPLSN
jgi:thymidylate synthase